MGQRLIITEEEKNRIKLLYEVTKTETTPPPNESELVVKDVNPFRYEQYADARRLYSPELKDGDRFYTYEGVGYEMGLTNELRKIIEGKSIRISSIDEIVTPEINQISYRKVWGGPKIIIYLNVLKPLITEIEVKPESYMLDFHSGLSDDEKLKIRNEFEPYLKNYILFVQTEFKKYLEKYNKYVEQKIDLQDVPDIYFEIYKIKRSQTDF
jgi:hypothetical protein